MSRATTDALASFADAAERAAERGTRTLASATVAIDPLDVTAAVLASRLASDRWFSWEQPERDGFALGTLGTAAEVVSRGPDRFDEVAADCTELVRDAVVDLPTGLPAGAGPVWTGGFAFAPDGGGSPPWSSLPPALMVLPELSLLRSGDGCWLTVNAVVDGPEGADRATEAAERRLQGLREGSLGLLAPAPTARAEISAPRPPSDFERSVAAAVDRIRGGRLEKVVLAREVTVESATAHDPGPVLAALREVFPSCFCFCVGTPEAAFLGASPELLIRRRGPVAATAALAG